MDLLPAEVGPLEFFFVCFPIQCRDAVPFSLRVLDAGDEDAAPLGLGNAEEAKLRIKTDIFLVDFLDFLRIQFFEVRDAGRLYLLFRVWEVEFELFWHRIRMIGGD